MLEIKDEHSESWVELTQQYYENNTDTNSEAAVGTVAVAAESEQSEQLGSTRRNGASTSELENEYPSLTEGPAVRQKERDFDVRSRLNRNRGDYHGDNGQWRDCRRGGYRDNAPWQRDHSRESYDSNPYSHRPRNAYRSADTSPFRSPLNREKRSGFRDFDNSSNFRFTSHGRGNGRSNGGNDKRSCRRLYPSSQDDYDEDETNRKFEVITDEDRVKLARREKDIAYGKNTDDYKKYVQTVPKNRRKGDRKKHPKTPDKYVNCSRRSWDAQVKKWKLSLHAWADNYQETGARGDCSQKSSCSEGTTLTTESTSEKEEDRMSALSEDNVECLGVKVKAEVKEDGEEGEDDKEGESEEEKEEDKSNEGEDDTFLDAVDYSSLVGNQEKM